MIRIDYRLLPDGVGVESLVHSVHVHDYFTRYFGLVTYHGYVLSGRPVLFFDYHGVVACPEDGREYYIRKDDVRLVIEGDAR